MLLTIHNLPTRTEYSDVKELIISKCGLNESILDNLQNEGSGMRVTVGVAEEEDAAILVRKINGLYFRGQQLYVEDKRQKQESEQPYRQQPQYVVAQPQLAYDYNSQMQASMGMYQTVSNYAMYQPQPAGQTVQNSYMAYGGQQGQPQPLMAQFTGGFNEYAQQPYSEAQRNPEAGDLFSRRSPSPGPRPREGGSRWDESRPSREDIRRRVASPPAFPARRDESPRQLSYQDSRDRPDRPRSFNQQDRFERPRQHDARGGLARSPRDMRGGHAQSARDTRGGHAPTARDTRGGHAPTARDMRRGLDPNARDMRGGHTQGARDMRGGHGPSARDMRGGYDPSARDTRGGYDPNARDTRGGYSDMRDDRSTYTHPKKRRWDESNDHYDGMPEQTQDDWNEPQTSRPSRALHREIRAPRINPKKFASNPVAAKNLKRSTSPAPVDNKLLKQCLIKGCGKIMFNVAQNLNILNHMEGPTVVKKSLRRVIGGRLPELVGTKILTPIDILALYREKYPFSEDTLVYARIMQGKPDKAPKRTIPDHGGNVKRDASKKKLPPIEPGKIPSYPQGDKKIHTQQKQQNIKDMATLEAYQVNATFQKAMDEECEPIGALLEKEFQNPANQEEKAIFSNLDKENFIDQCKKLIKHHLSRRITNAGVKLVRIFGRPKPPPRTALEQYLVQHGCLSLKKSVKSVFYTASFDSYDTIDHLCSLEPVQIHDSMVSFKHMQYGPRKPKIDQKTAKVLRKKYVDSLIQKSEVNLLDKDWEIKDKEEKAKAENNDADDVIFVNNPNELTVDITDETEDAETKKENETEEKSKVSAVTTEENQDFLHGDFKVIDEVRESDNDEVVNDSVIKNEGVENDGDEIGDDWDETGDDWGDDSIKNNKNDDNNDGEDDANDSDHENGEENCDDENAEDIDIADVDWDDINEDDLEDY